MKKFSSIFLLMLIIIGWSAGTALAQWQPVGGTGLVAANAADQALVVDANNTPFIAYRDEANGYKAAVKKLDGNTWVNVGGHGISAGYASSLSLALDAKGTPYVAFLDNGNRNKVAVKKFNGTTWVNVGTTGFAAHFGTGISLVTDGQGTLYLAYSDDTKEKKATVKKFDGTTWENVGLAGFTPYIANGITLAIDKAGTPYVAYTDEENNGKATVKKFDGSNWLKVGEAFSDNYAPKIGFTLDNEGTPYAIYRDEANGFKATVKKFNGSSWVTLGTEGFSAGEAANTRLVVDGTGTVYAAYVDFGNGAFGNTGRIQVRRFISSGWENIGPADLLISNICDLSMAVNGEGLPYIGFSCKHSGWKASVLRITSTTPFFTSLTKDTGKDNDRVTSDRTLMFSGTSYKNATIQLYRNGVALTGTVVADNTGKWSYDYQRTALKEGKHVFTATATLNGVTSNPSPEYDVIVDTTTPVTPALVAINNLPLENLNLKIASDFSGTAEAGTTVSLYNGTVKIGSVRADENGTWTIKVPALADGNYTLTAIVTDVAGNTSPASPVLSINIDNSAPAAPANFALAPGSDLGVSATDRITCVSKPTITGKTEADALMTIYLDGKIVATTTADGNGNWTYTFSTPLEAGTRNITVTATDKAGNTSVRSTPLTITLNLKAPVVKNVTDGGVYTTNRTITFNEGTATINNKPYTSGTLFSLEGEHTLIVSDIAGNTTTIKFTIDKTDPSGTIVINNDAVKTNLTKANLNIAAVGATYMRFYNSSTGTWTTWEPVATTKAWNLTSGDGSKKVSVQFRDAAGNNSPTFSDYIILDQRAPTVIISSNITKQTTISSIPVKITFSENVTNFASADITLSNGEVSNFSGSGKYYSFNVNPALTGLLTINIAAGVVEDEAGNQNLMAKPFNLSYIGITAPSVTTDPANSVEITAATLSGTVVATGGSAVTERGIVYSKTGTPTVADNKIILGSGADAFSTTVNDLTGSTTYYVRAYAVNARGIGYGNEQSFTTNAPIVVPTPPANLSQPNTQQVISFTLINADTDTEIQTLTDGATLNLATLPTQNLNIRANTNVAAVGSVEFTLTGTQSKTVMENKLPYALFGGTATDYSAWTPALGRYSLTATPYSTSAGRGTAGTALTVNFKVINQASNGMTSARNNSKENLDPSLATVYPNPATTRLNIEMSEAGEGVTVLNLLDLSGRQVLTQSVNTTSSLNAILDVDHLQEGVYMLTINTPKGRISKRIIIK